MKAGGVITFSLLFSRQARPAPAARTPQSSSGSSHAVAHICGRDFWSKRQRVEGLGDVTPFLTTKTVQTEHQGLRKQVGELIEQLLVQAKLPRWNLERQVKAVKAGLLTWRMGFQSL